MTAQTSLDGHVSLQVVVPEITQRISGSARTSLNKYLRVCVMEEILIFILAMLSGMLVAIIIHDSFMQNSQKVIAELRREIRELRTANQRLADENRNIHRTTLAPSAFSDKPNSDNLHAIKGGEKAGLVIDMRRYEHKHLPFLCSLLGKLRRRGISATFFFGPRFYKPNVRPRIFDQLNALGHKVGIAENERGSAGNDTPIMTSSERNYGGKFTTNLRFAFTRPIDAEAHPVSVLQNLVRDTKPGDIVLVDILNFNAVRALMNAFPYHSNPTSVRMVKVGALLRQRDRPST